MTLDRIWQLDPSGPSSNSNYQGANIAELCLPSGINNALRAIGSMVTRELAFQAAAISASVSTNIVTSSTGLFVPITGANAIASFGVIPGEQPSAAVLRFVQFSSSASLSNGAALRLIGGVSRKTQPGDIGGYIHVGSGDEWHEFLYSPANGSPLGGSISLSTVNAITSSIGTLNVTGSASVSSLNVAGIAVPPRYGFHATTANTTTISTTAAPIAFGTETFDIGGFFSSSTWTPPAGLAEIGIQVEFFSISTTTNFNLCLLENSVTVTRRTEAGRGNSQSSLTINRFISTDGTKGYTVSAYREAVGNDGMIASTGAGSVFFCGAMV